MPFSSKIAFALFCSLILGQSLGQDTTLTLPSIPVIGNQSPAISQTDIFSATPNFILSEERLGALGVLDVGDALKYVPGVQLKDYGGIGGIKSVSYRSLGAAHTIVLLDGNTQHDNQTGAINLSGFETFGVKNIIFSSGQPSTNEALPSAYLPANSISIASSLQNPPSKLAFEIRQNLTTVHAFESAANLQVPIAKNGFVGIQGFVKYGTGTYKYVYPLLGNDDSHNRLNSKILNQKIRLVGGSYFKHGKLSGTFFYNENDQQLPGAVILYNPSNDQSIYNKDYRADVNWTGFITPKWSFAFNGFGKSNYTEYKDPTFLNQQGFLNSTYLQEAIGTGVIFNRALRLLKEKIFFGFDIKSTRLYSNQFFSDPNRVQAASVIGVKKWIKKVRIEANIAHQFIEDKTLDSELGTKVYSKFSPYLAVAVLPFKEHNINIRAFYKHAFRMPSFNDLYYNFIGNSLLKPENAHISNLGMTYSEWFHPANDKSHGLKIEATLDGYFNQVTDKIVAIPTKDLFNWSMQNIGKTESFGTDVSLLVQRIVGRWKYGVSTLQSINKTVDITDPNLPSYGHQIPYTPKYNASYSGNVSYKGYQFDANMIYTGGRYVLNENIFSNYLNPFIDINLGLQKEFKIIKDLRFTVNAKVMNLLNKNYEVIKSFPMPGRYYQVRLKLSFR
jgi:vitamin B12 transporter